MAKTKPVDTLHINARRIHAGTDITIIHTSGHDAVMVRRKTIEDCARAIQPDPNVSEYIATMRAAKIIRELDPWNL